MVGRLMFLTRSDLPALIHSSSQARGLKKVKQVAFWLLEGTGTEEDPLPGGED